MNFKAFENHLKIIVQRAKEALEKASVDSLIIHSGSEKFRAFDDQEFPFKPLPHFSYFIPTNGPNHFIILEKDSERPLLIQTVPDDFWLEHSHADTKLQELFAWTIVKNSDEAWALADKSARGVRAFIGDTESTEKAKTLNQTFINPESVLLALNNARSHKTEYEIECIEIANQRASEGHKKAYEAFQNGMSELEIHHVYMQALETTEIELPYPTIVALNEKSSVLHYQHKRHDVRNGKTFLIDAGAVCNGYASDITRTYSQKAHPVFNEVLSSIIELQHELTKKVKPGAQFIELHHEAHTGMARILSEHKLATGSAEDLIESGVTRAFFPHGLGHMLGIQVHDVGGSSVEGFEHPLRKLYPKIRTNRILEKGNVTTIEPGLYFIPLLLEPLKRDQKTNEFLNWKLIDELIPLGGIRIEDNIVVTENGAQNLTRNYLP